MRWAWELLYIFRKFSQRESCLSQRHKIVLAHTLEDEKYRGCVTGIGDQMRAARPDGIGLPRCQAHFFFGFAGEDANFSSHDVKRVLYLVVIVPWHCLGRAYLHLSDTETGACGVILTTFDLVDLAGIFNCWPHFILLRLIILSS